MSLEFSKDDAKKDPETNSSSDSEIEDDIGGTKQENDQVQAQLSQEQSQEYKSKIITNPANWTELPLNISVNQIDELFPHIDKVPANEHNYIAIINYLQTYHLALSQVDAQLKSANNTIQAYEEDIRRFQESGKTISDESNEWFMKAKKLEDTQKKLLDYINSLRGRYAADIAKRFSDAFQIMKEADELSNNLAAEFTFLSEQPVEKQNKQPNGELDHNHHVVH